MTFNMTGSSVLSLRLDSFKLSRVCLKSTKAWRGVMSAIICTPIIVIVFVGMGSAVPGMSKGAGGGWPWRGSKVSVNGWVSDAACGAEHTKPGGASCVRKCIAGGTSIGHPEWKPQKMVLVDDADKSIWVVQNPSVLKGNEGRHVTLRCRLNRTKHELKVVSIESVIE
ncbi:MAG TPA: hypothetical protein VLZ81_10345 [Blastocatellia bacterium]|nr:hypothetical protein [Blastocatellia bacterium]